MSFVLTAPELVTVAAGDLAGIGSTLREVSVAISALFGAYGREFQAVSAQAAAFHDEFVSLLNVGAATYLSTELASAEQSLLGARPVG